PRGPHSISISPRAATAASVELNGRNAYAGWPHAQRTQNRTAVARSATLFRAITEIIEQGHAVRFGPNANFSRILERLVIPVDGFLPIEHHGEMVALKIHTQAVPLIRRHLHIRPLLFRTPAVDGVANHFAAPVPVWVAVQPTGALPT